VGPIDDGGWTFSHEQGRLALLHEYGDRITTVHVQKVPEGSAGEPVFRELVSEGCDLIFGTVFGYMKPMLKVSAANPKVRFEHAMGYKRTNNLRTYDIRMYQAAYLAGIAAASTSVSGSLGFVGSIQVPEVVVNLNAFTLGAQTVLPEVKVFAVWVNEWFNPAEEARAAEILIDQGADVLIQNTDSSAVMRMAERKGKRAIGIHSDMSKYGPVAHLGSLVALWGPYYIETVRQVLEGSWRSTNSWWGLRESAVDLLSLADDMDPSVKASIGNAKEAIRRGQLDMWRGPIRSRSGAIQVPAGATLSDQQLQAMDFLVSGISTWAPSLRD
jgi:basic membrane protein A